MQPFAGRSCFAVSTGLVPRVFSDNIIVVGFCSMQEQDEMCFQVLIPAMGLRGAKPTLIAIR